MSVLNKISSVLGGAFRFGAPPLSEPIGLLGLVDDSKIGSVFEGSLSDVWKRIQKDANEAYKCGVPEWPDIPTVREIDLSQRRIISGRSEIDLVITGITESTEESEIDLLNERIEETRAKL